MADKVVKTTLPVVDPPAPATGGRIVTPAGEIAQIISSDICRHLAYIEFKTGLAPRGHHYHKQKHEYLYIVRGKLQVMGVDLDSQERTVLALETGDLLYLPPNNAHAFNALEYTQAIEFSPQPFDVNDTISYHID